MDQKKSLMFKIVFSNRKSHLIRKKKAIYSMGYKLMLPPLGALILRNIRLEPKLQREVFMSWLIQFLRNRQVRKHMKARMKEWLCSESVEERFSIAASPVKQ